MPRRMHNGDMLKTEVLIVKMAPDEKARLALLASVEGLTISELVRGLIRAATKKALDKAAS